MKDSIEIYLSLEHLNPDLVDIPVEVDLHIYHGSDDESTNSEDPSEIEIIKITIEEEVRYVENGVTYTLYKGDVIHSIDDKMEEQIYEKYAQTNQ